MCGDSTVLRPCGRRGICFRDSAGDFRHSSLGEIIGDSCVDCFQSLNAFEYKHGLQLTMVTLVEHRAFLNSILDRQAERRRLIDPEAVFPTQPVIRGRIPRAIHHRTSGDDEGETDGWISKENVANYVKEEETIRNDYCEWYGATGECGSNFIMGAEGEDICSE